MKQLKRRLTTEAFLPPPSKVKNVAEASAISKRPDKCTKKRCNGVNHNPEQCFKKPGNEHLQREWIAERVRLGQWKGKTPRDLPKASASAAVRIDEPSIEDLEASFNRINTSACHASAVRISSTKVNLPDHKGSFQALINTAASRHIFTTYTNVTHLNEQLDMAGGSTTLQIHGRGSVSIIGPDGDVFVFSNCLCPISALLTLPSPRKPPALRPGLLALFLPGPVTLPVGLLGLRLVPAAFSS